MPRPNSRYYNDECYDDDCIAGVAGYVAVVVHVMYQLLNYHLTAVVISI